MKKRLLKIFFTLGMFTGAFAQNVNLGITYGYSLSTFRGGESLGLGENVFGNSADAYLGLYSDIRVSEKIGFQMEALLTGFESSAEVSTGNNFGGFVAYFTVPLITKYYFTESLHLQLGPQFNFGLANDKNPEDDQTENLVFGIHTGVGFDNLGRRRIE